MLLPPTAKSSQYAKLVHHGLEKLRRDQTVLINASAIVVSSLARSHGVLYDRAVCRILEPPVTVLNQSRR